MDPYSSRLAVDSEILNVVNLMGLKNTNTSQQDEATSLYMPPTVNISVSISEVMPTRACSLHTRK